MPDWLDDDDLEKTELAPAEPPRSVQRRRARLDRRTAQDQAISDARAQTSPVAYLVGAVLVIALVIGAAFLLPRITGRSDRDVVDGTATPPPATTSVDSSASTANPSPSPDQSTSSSSTSTPSQTPSRALSKDKLGKAWLTGFLTRTDRTDDSWSTTIADITTPDLLTRLDDAGPDYVGFYKLDSWKVKAISRYDGDPKQVPISTPSRQVLAYTVKVSDGRTTMSKPFILTAYQVDDRWVVAILTMPYTSEG